MPTPRFYYPNKLSLDNIFKLPDNLTHYAMRVLRLNDGVDIILFDNTGGQYTAKLEIQGKNFFALPYKFENIERELKQPINLFQGIASGDKMDWIIEKAVELGVQNFYPLNTQRSILKLSAARLDKRLSHWHAVAQSASEQCGRNRLMTVHRPTSLAASMANLSKFSLFCHPEGELDLNQQLQSVTSALDIIIGPEGGWSDHELEIAAQHKLTPVRFGQRILRTETAGIVMTAAACAILNW